MNSVNDVNDLNILQEKCKSILKYEVLLYEELSEVNLFEVYELRFD